MEIGRKYSVRGLNRKYITASILFLNQIEAVLIVSVALGYQITVCSYFRVNLKPNVNLEGSKLEL